MKTKNIITTAILLAGLLPMATYAQVENEIEVTVDNNNGIITKHVTVNGQPLDEAGIAKLEADGNVQIIRLDGIDAEIGDVMTLTTHDDLNVDADKIQITVNTDDGVTTKTVIMNGKELNEDEIAELEASGQLKSLNIDATTIGAGSMHKVMFLDGDATDRDSKQIIKMSSKSIHIDTDGATLGFMTNIKKDGWHVISVSKGSGAEESGLKAGDIIKFMGDMDLSNSSDTVFEKLRQKPQHEAGEMVDLEVERDGELIYMSVEARKNDSIDMIIGSGSGVSWTDKLEGLDLDSLSNGKSIKIMMNGGDLAKSINLSDLDVSLPEMLGNMNIFISDGSSTSKLLGKNHEMNSLSDGLSRYFGTKGGVLMTHVADDNVFGLEDGDVIKSIAGVDVNSPKDVIKQLLKSDKQQDLKLKIVRHKKNKTLKYHK